MADGDGTRRAAIEAHGATWTLLEKPDRTPEETARMIALARASLAAWGKAGGPVEAQRGNWLVARVYLAAGEAEPALRYANRTIELTHAHAAALADFDLAFAEEIAARAWAAAGDGKKAKAHREEARALGNAITDGGDRKEFFRQFEAEPWFELDGA